MSLEESYESLGKKADDALREVLRATSEGSPLVVVASPPGAGKTFSIEVLAAQQSGILGEVIAIATTTRAQAQALIERLAGWEGFEKIWFVPKGQQVVTPPGVSVVRSIEDFPDSKAVIVATAAKWSRTSGVFFPLLVIDEAWQLPFATFAPLSVLAERFVMVGDPGQIAPVVRVDVSRWKDDPSGPHVPAPIALERLGLEGLVKVSLPATRRLPSDTARIISRSFYPDMPFGSLAEHRVLSGGWSETISGSIGILEVGERRFGQHDRFVSEEAARLAKEIIFDGTIETDIGTKKVTPSDVGIVCSYVHQVPEVRAALGPNFSEVFVETANRWQGLECDVIIGIHPLSGQSTPTEFAMDSGRLCVMCSRHRAACLLIGRPGLVESASSGRGVAERHFGDTLSSARLGWQSHLSLLKELGLEAF